MQDFHLRLLVVDDEADALFLLDHQLRRLGCATSTAASAAEARRCLAAQPFDLILCDLDLPGESGLDLLRWVRAQALACEMILLTARPTVATAIQALRAGAADYLTRPVTLDDLVPALQRIAERLRQGPGPEPALPGTAELPPLPAASQYHIGPVLLDLDRFVVTVQGRSVAATPSEIEILHCLCRHPDRVVTPQELVQSLRGYQVEPHQAPEIIRPHISNLRRKLLAAALEADVVRTVRGVGYILREPIIE
jgi:DNA-binding response OmpR family regulator